MRSIECRLCLHNTSCRLGGLMSAAIRIDVELSSLRGTYESAATARARVKRLRDKLAESVRAIVAQFVAEGDLPDTNVLVDSTEPGAVHLSIHDGLGPDWPPAEKTQVRLISEGLDEY